MLNNWGRVCIVIGTYRYLYEKMKEEKEKERRRRRWRENQKIEEKIEGK